MVIGMGLMAFTAPSMPSNTFPREMVASALFTA